MKRSQLRRYAPLRTKRELSNINKPRKALPRVSKRRKAVNAEQKPTLDEYRAEFPWCQYPGCMALANAVHEICNGPDRMKAREQRALILRLCQTHHDLMPRLSDVEQLAIKFVSASGYCLATYIQVKRPSAPRLVEQWEVDAAVRVLKKRFAPGWSTQ